MANLPSNIDVWQSKRLDGLVFYHGSGVTHPYPLHWHENSISACTPPTSAISATMEIHNLSPLVTQL